MDLNLKGKIVVITGAAGKKGSIGATILFELSKEGAKTAVIDRNNRGFDYAEELSQNGNECFFVKADITKPKQVEDSMNTIINHFGRIDILINNVGVNDGVGLDGSYDDFLSSLHLNLISYFMITKHAVKMLKESKGVILNIGSKVALTGQGGTSGYAASKGGVLALTREWAVDLLKYQVRVNALIISESLTPAYKEWLNTLEDGEEKYNKILEKIPLGKRMTTPKEITDTALFLISERSSHTTGQFVFCDGGYVHLDRSLLNH